MPAYYSNYYKRPSSVYRLYNEDGDLLYVGLALRPENRVMRHRNKHWGAQIARMDVEWFENREAAKAAERWAIYDENPIYNLMRPLVEGRR